jgi:hypothetical protein
LHSKKNLNTKDDIFLHLFLLLLLLLLLLFLLFLLLNSRPCVCHTGVLQLEPHPQPFLL